MATIDEVVNSASPKSVEVDGQKLAVDGIYLSTLITAEVSSLTGTGDYAVDLECAVVPKAGSPRFGKIGSFTEIENGLPAILEISIGCLYRFRHLNGVPTSVRLSG